ncbi:hypothetical protein J4H86_17205 [Spiractinospora alimapuensis]|uniref:hypothetical protein n=1 Tax=Spiractinospora alimapuensis TaxID=2820884 RepID=UPI001F2902C1|nr:hypothetical protein [Spiractinospora alimapuensis]QVQ50630.1 hypothetical protein J4H86_17205 [Spiractinospora alimapuensis]
MDGASDRSTRSDAVYLGWRHTILAPDPGAPPKRPTPGDILQVSDEWLAEQRREGTTTNRPLWLAALGLVLMVVLWPVLGQLRILPGVLVVVLVALSVLLAVPLAVALWQGHSVTRARMAAERERVAARQESAERELRDRQREHAERYREWQQRKQAFEAQPRWYTVTVPRRHSRVDLIGGTDAGWAAVLTTMAGSRLRSGADVTILDLTGRAVASGLVALSRACGIPTAVRVVPADVSRLGLGTDLPPRAFAEVLARVARIQDPNRSLDADRGLLAPLVELVGVDVPAILTALATVGGDTDADTLWSNAEDAATLRATLREQLGEDRRTRDRAWGLQQLLTPLESLGTRLAGADPTQLTVVATDRGSGRSATALFGGYVASVMAERLRAGEDQEPDPWWHTVIVCGAEHLGGAEIDHLTAAADRSGAGVVFLRGRVVEDGHHPADNSMVLAMRMPDALSARIAAERLRGSGGDPAALTPHPLTEIVGEALRDSVPSSYRPDSVTVDTGGYPRMNAGKLVAPLEYVRQVRTATSWGRTTRQAEEIDSADPLGDTGRAVEVDEKGLRTLPFTALVAREPDGLVLVDANPGIMGLPTATLTTVRDTPPPLVPAHPPQEGETEANLGPPPSRLDWRSGTG